MCQPLFKVIFIIVSFNPCRGFVYCTVLLSVYTQEDGDMKTLSNVPDQGDNKQQKWDLSWAHRLLMSTFKSGRVHCQHSSDFCCGGG